MKALKRWNRRCYKIRKDLLKQVEKENLKKQRIEEEEKNWKPKPFNIYQHHGSYVKLENYTCPLCNGNIVTKQGRYGAFEGCSNWPNCKFTRNINKPILIKRVLH